MVRQKSRCPWHPGRWGWIPGPRACLWASWRDLCTAAFLWTTGFCLHLIPSASDIHLPMNPRLLRVSSPRRTAHVSPKPRRGLWHSHEAGMGRKESALWVSLTEMGLALWVCGPFVSPCCSGSALGSSHPSLLPVCLSPLTGGKALPQQSSSRQGLQQPKGRPNLL